MGTSTVVAAAAAVVVVLVGVVVSEGVSCWTLLWGLGGTSPGRARSAAGASA